MLQEHTNVNGTCIMSQGFGTHHQVSASISGRSRSIPPDDYFALFYDYNPPIIHSVTPFNESNGPYWRL